MINLEQTFTPRVNPADTDYPFGSIKDNTSPGANDGTPLSAVWGNDFEGFRQAAMTEAGITPSGLPDTAQDSQLLEAVKAVTSDALRGDISNYQQYTFTTVAKMQTGETTGGLVISLKAGDICHTGATKWRIGSNASGVPVAGSLYAEPLTAICMDDYALSSDVDNSSDIQSMLNCANSFGISRVYSNGGKMYKLQNTVTIPGSVELDFGWSILIDDVRGLRADLSNRAAPTFILYGITGGAVRRVNHTIAATREQSNGGAGADIIYWMGGQQLGASFTNDCHVSDIVMQGTKRGCMPVGVVGNIKNWSVRRIDVYGDASWGIDIEWGWQGATSPEIGIPEDPSVNQTLDNGQLPYNGVVENFNGYELYNCKGFLRTAGIYNVLFKNCEGYDVANFIYVYGGDRNPSRFAQNDRFKGCKLKLNRNTFTSPTLCITVLFPNKDGTTGVDLPSWTSYVHTVSFDDCEIQANYQSGSFQTCCVRLYGCDGAVEFNRCIFRNSYFGARFGYASNPSYTSRFAAKFNSCIFVNNYQDAKVDSVDGVVFDKCKFLKPLGTELPSVDVGVGAANYNKFIDCLWSGQNDRTSGVQAFVRLGSGIGNELVRCRFEPYSSTYKPIAYTGSSIFRGHSNSSTGALIDTTNGTRKILGEPSTTIKSTSGLSGVVLDFNVAETWITNSAMSISQVTNGIAGSILTFRGATTDTFVIQHNAATAGTGRFINLTNANYSHSAANWVHKYISYGGDWYEI